MVYTYEFKADTLVYTILYQSVMSLNGISIHIVSVRPAPQPCMSVLMVQGIQEH